MSEPRFYVRELTGWPIRERQGSTNALPRTSFYIMDRLYNCNVVETWERDGVTVNQRLEWIRRQAYERCAQLNEWWRLELARG